MVRLRSPNLVRNGSFETGDLSFWYKKPSGGIAEVTDSICECGNYSCRLSRGTVSYAYLETNDYIPVKVGYVYDIDFWLKTTVLGTVRVALRFFNEDYEYIETRDLIYSENKTYDGYQHFTVLVPERAVYMRLYFFTEIGGPYYMYVDCVSVTQRTVDEQPVAVIKMAEERNVTTKGWHYCDQKFSGFYNMADFVLNVSNFQETGGTNPVTLDVKIQSKDTVTGVWVDIVTFTQITCGAGQSYAGSEGKQVTGNLREYIRVIYNVGGDGTVGDLDLNVSAVLKR